MTSESDRRERPAETRICAEDGFMLIAVIIMVFLVLLVLSIAAPRLSQQLRREQDLEAKHRAEQYVVAIRKFYGTFGRYPSSVKELEGTNNQRFLRQEYADPLTGKSDWRLIHLGENKTKVKGLFGQDLPGLSGGLGAAAGMQSSPGVTPSAFGNSGATGSAGGLGSAANPASGNGLGSSSPTNSGLGAGTGVGTTPATPGASASPGTTAAASGTPGSSTDTNGFGSSGFPTTGGLIMGIGVPKSGNSVASQNGESTYQKWEFLYDPRIEQLHAGWSVFGGGGPGSTPASALGGGQQNGTPGLSSGSSLGSTSANGLGSGSGLGSGFGTTQQTGATSSSPATTPADPNAPGQQPPANPQTPSAPGTTSPQ